MTLLRRMYAPAALAALLICAAGSAADKDKELVELKVDQLKEPPADRKAFYAKAANAKGRGVQVQWVTFFRPGTDESLNSVAAGDWFDIHILLDRAAPEDIQVTLTPFRLDTTGLGSGNVKVIPIVTGGGADEKYWARQPPSPVTIQSGSFGVRLRYAGQVRPDAKQPPGGDATKPFDPVKFPDYVILFVKHGNSVLTPTLRITE